MRLGSIKRIERVVDIELDDSMDHELAEQTKGPVLVPFEINAV